MIPPGFPRRSRWWIVASLAELLNLPAIIAVTWYEWELRPSEVRLAGHQIDAPTPLARVGIAFGFPADLAGGSVRHLGSIALAKRPLQLIQKPPVKMGQLDSPSPPQCEANHVLLAGEICRDKSSHSATIAPLLAAVQPADSTPQPEAKTPPSGLSKRPVKRHTIFPEHRRKGTGMKRHKAGTNRSRFD